MRRTATDGEERSVAARPAVAAAALGVLYVSSVLVLVTEARKSWAPFLPDEAQYTLVAENLLRHGRFEYRGDFPLLVPPVYPALLAVFRFLTGDLPLESAVPFFNGLAWCLAAFPAWGLARALGLDRATAWLAAAAAVWVPGAWLASRAMAEPVFHPLAVTAMWLGFRSLASPGRRWPIAHGLVLALLVLTKPAGLALAGAWMLALLAAPGRERRAIGIAIAVAASAVVPWLAVRGVFVGWSVADAIVAYRAEGYDFSAARFFASDVPAHLAYAFVTSGGGLALAFLLGLRDLAVRADGGRPAAVFCGSLVILAALGAAFFDAVQLGRFADRYLLLLHPLVLVVSLRGLAAPARGRPIALVSGSLFLAALSLVWLDPGVGRSDPLLSAPFVHGLALLGAGATGWEAAAHATAFLRRAALVAVVFSILWWLSSRIRARLAAAFAAALLLAVTGTVFASLERRALASRRAIAENPRALVGWLARHVDEGAPLLVLGERAPFEPRRPELDPEPWIRDATRAFGPSPRDLLRAEARLRYDVRMVPRVERLGPLARETGAAWFLTAVPLAGLSPVAANGEVALYRLDPRSSPVVAADVRFFLRELGVPGVRFREPGLAGPGGWSRERPGLLAEGKLGELSPGVYRLRVCWRPRAPGSRLALEVRDAATGGAVAAATIGGTTRSRVFEFPAAAGADLSLRVSLEAGEGLFCGALVEPAGRGPARPFRSGRRLPPAAEGVGQGS